MVHELMSIKHNTVDMQHMLGENVSEEMRQIVLSADDD